MFCFSFQHTSSCTTILYTWMSIAVTPFNVGGCRFAVARDVSITQLQMCCSKGCQHMLTGQSASVSCRCAVARDMLTGQSASLSWSTCLIIKALHDPNSWQRCELCKQTAETYWLCYSYSIKSCNTAEVSLFLCLHKEFHLPTFIPTL